MLDTNLVRLFSTVLHMSSARVRLEPFLFFFFLTRVRKIAKIHDQLRHVVPSIRPQWNHSAPTKTDFSGICYLSTLR